jgi:dihydrofolate reductase
MPKKLILYIAMSLDGYIARPDGDLDWLSSVERPGEDYGYADFVRTVDTVIMGRKTYDKVLSFGIPFPHSDRECYIITRQERPPEGNVVFYAGSLPELINELKNKPGGNIYCDGGAELVHALRRDNLIDTCVVSIIPVLLGAGIRLFQDGSPENALQLVESKAFESGLVQLRYDRGL